MSTLNKADIIEIGDTVKVRLALASNDTQSSIRGTVVYVPLNVGQPWVIREEAGASMGDIYVIQAPLYVRLLAKAPAQ